AQIHQSHMATRRARPRSRRARRMRQLPHEFRLRFRVKTARSSDADARIIADTDGPIPRLQRQQTGMTAE
ncbi:hypothetical protein, partial [Methylobacterium haplocladii]|uniref:hypothetical protein n=1 Tax=Methylobacterium haplocladii TaxID=1176176 RepID=UPI0024E09C4C